MKRIYKFLFYKLYRFAISNEKSAPIDWSFISLATIFEIFHLLILGLLLKFFKLEFYLNTKFTPILLLVFGALLNYFCFIRNKAIHKINSDFQKQNRTIWKDNLWFFGYVIMLFVIMFIQVYILKRNGKA